MKQRPFISRAQVRGSYRPDAEAATPWITPALELLGACKSEIDALQALDLLPEAVAAEAVAFMAQRHTYPANVVRALLQRLGKTGMRHVLDGAQFGAVCKRYGID